MPLYQLIGIILSNVIFGLLVDWLLFAPVEVHPLENWGTIASHTRKILVAFAKSGRGVAAMRTLTPCSSVGQVQASQQRHDAGRCTPNFCQPLTTVRLPLNFVRRQA